MDVQLLIACEVDITQLLRSRLILLPVDTSISPC